MLYAVNLQTLNLSNKHWPTVTTKFSSCPGWLKPQPAGDQFLYIHIKQK